MHYAILNYINKWIKDYLKNNSIKLESAGILWVSRKYNYYLKSSYSQLGSKTKNNNTIVL